ncbi:hypothetical protein D8Y22_18330 [Salinadaptatus halalkaliphilus]|uniref:Uncharacterized protein n=2 Tax=Salinadaptatus halalkaliphilus TaxID=2419781 RepID=A0A4S3THL3_9EURY|nr:hypothetical protein [Salinadaptatus halalkaliphilus]THE63406.1 hypothetical protein D8Y22_18330 [Salinadaptatus halalkaliphilus]
MVEDTHPIPQEALPPEWGPADVRDGRLGYRRGRLPIELIADRVTADQCHPALGVGCCWELRCRYSLGDRSVTETIGHVSTRTAAADGLLECMHRIQAATTDPSDPIRIWSALEDVSFADVVPTRVSW